MISMIKRGISAAARNRKPFKTITEKDVAFFESILPKSSILRGDPDDSEMQPYNIDWMKKYRGKSSLVLLPRDTESVSRILNYCNKEKIAVVPQGGNTGLVGGGVPVFDEVVVNMKNMSNILEFDETTGILVCESGCILENLDNYLAAKKHVMPLDLGAKGSCQLGGNISTNAGGLRLLRYGSLHGSVLGIESVLPDGQIYNDLKKLRKDNTGYDLKQLFIGSEGTLGYVCFLDFEYEFLTISIITKAAVLTVPLPKSFTVSLLTVDSYDKIGEIFVTAKECLAEIMSAFEFWDNEALKLVVKHSSKSFPLNNNSGFYVLLETSGSSKDHDEEKLHRFLDVCMSSNLITDGTISQDLSQYKNLWSFRELIPEACSKSGAVYKYDLSLPLSKMYDLVEDVRKRLISLNLLKEGLDDSIVNSVIGYGHVGDGNLHLNVSAKSYCEDVANALEPYVYDYTSNLNGSISAEHGVGLMKQSILPHYKDSVSLASMRGIKNLFDPNGIMNPYKVL